MPVIKKMHTCTGPVKASCLIFFLQITNERGVDFNIPVQFQSNKVFSYRSTEEQNIRQWHFSWKKELIDHNLHSKQIVYHTETF